MLRKFKTEAAKEKADRRLEEKRTKKSEIAPEFPPKDSVLQMFIQSLTTGLPY